MKSLDDRCINILVIPEILDIIFGPNVVPNLVLGDPVISENLDDLLDNLDQDQTILDIDEYLGTDPTLTGDPTVGGGLCTLDSDCPEGYICVGGICVLDGTGPTLTPGIGGSTVTTPTITDPTTTEDTDTDPVISDPNNITTIEDYTPETNPYSCS